MFCSDVAGGNADLGKLWAPTSSLTELLMTTLLRAWVWLGSPRFAWSPVPGPRPPWAPGLPAAFVLCTVWRDRKAGRRYPRLGGGQQGEGVCVREPTGSRVRLSQEDFGAQSGDALFLWMAQSRPLVVAILALAQLSTDCDTGTSPDTL